MDTLEKVSLRLEVLRTALEFGTQRDILEPDKLFDKYWEIVMRGSEKARPKDNRKDDSLMVAQKPRSVRKGSASQLV
tara:strand:+ start:3898 stop:4128 length:231 start_codon:yes stop_codon:yes gene_type:complete